MLNRAERSSGFLCEKHLLLGGCPLGPMPCCPLLRLPVFAEGHVEMFNPNCQLINFIRHLKQRGGVDVRGSWALEVRVERCLWSLRCL